MDSVMSRKKEAVPSGLLSKECLSQFKTEADGSKFFKELHSQVLEQRLQDSHLGYEKHSADGNNTGNSRNGSFPKKIQTEYGEGVIQIPRDRRSEFELVVVSKHQSRGLSIEKLFISLYAQGLSVSDIEDVLREIYEINFSTSAIPTSNLRSNDWWLYSSNLPWQCSCSITELETIYEAVMEKTKGEPFAQYAR